MQVHEKTLTSVPVLTPRGTEAGRLYFLPADLGLYQRLNDSRNAIIETLTSISNASINPDGSGADPESEGIINAAEQQLYELLNYVCGVETCPEVFRRYRPFAIMANKRFWASCAVAAIDTALEIATANAAKIQKKMRRRR